MGGDGAVRATACAKAILLGEHFVVHGSACLAVPVSGLLTTVVVRRPSVGSTRGVEEPVVVTTAAGPGPVLAVRRAASLLGLDLAGVVVDVESSVPTGCGLGSSASFAVALLRALSGWLESPLSPEALNAAAYEIETLAHGTPSGVDNTVIAMERALQYRRGQAPLPLRGPGIVGALLPAAHQLVIADSGQRCPTADAVARVASYASAHPEVFRSLLADAEVQVSRGTEAFEKGDAVTLAAAMRENHGLLREVGVSSTALDSLVRAAERAGALGAKLTGAGVGGCIVALARASAVQPIQEALISAGAVATFATPLYPE